MVAERRNATTGILRCHPRRAHRSGGGHGAHGVIGLESAWILPSSPIASRYFTPYFAR
jgi:hypothetical protein